MSRFNLVAFTAVALCCLALPRRSWTQDRPVLELSLDEAVRRALENNVDIAVERFSPEEAASTVKQAEGVYDPYFASTLRKTSTIQPQRSVFTGGDKVETDSFVYNFGLAQEFRTGGRLQFQFDNSRSNTNSVYTTFNPSFASDFTASLTQPLLRDRSIDAGRQQLKVAKNNREITDIQFRQTVINTLANVKNRYYDLLLAIDNLEAQRKSLALAQKLLEENRIKVRVGTLAPLDVVAAESEVASREEGVIVAQASLEEAEDALKRAIVPGHDPEVWALRIVPTDRPTAEPVEVNAEAAIRAAIESRTDVVAARKNLESSEIMLKYRRNQTLPALDLVASYGGSGVGGTELRREGFGGPILEEIPGGYGDAVSDALSFEYPTWAVGVSFSYPIRNRSAQAASARARIAHEQNLASFRRLELMVATEVRTAARAVETNFKRVESTRAARRLQEQRLDAEEKKFAAGMSTNFLVTQAQRDLALAEVAELRAVADYRKSLVDFERVQEAGVSGIGGSTVTVSSGSSLTRSDVQSSQSGAPQPY